MRKLIILFIVLSNCPFVFAQNVDSSVNKPIKIRAGKTGSMDPLSTIMENIASSPDFSILANAIKVAGLTDTFNANASITLFAPDNKAFVKLPSWQIDTLLLPSHKADLTKLIYSHVVSGNLTVNDLENLIKAGHGQATLTTLSGSIFTARINENRNIVLIDENSRQNIISRFNIKQSNGLMHVITGVLTPKLTQGLQTTSKP